MIHHIPAGASRSAKYLGTLGTCCSNNYPAGTAASLLGQEGSTWKSSRDLGGPRWQCKGKGGRPTGQQASPVGVSGSLCPHLMRQPLLPGVWRAGCGGRILTGSSSNTGAVRWWWHLFLVVAGVADAAANLVKGPNSSTLLRGPRDRKTSGAAGAVNL